MRTWKKCCVLSLTVLCLAACSATGKGADRLPEESRASAGEPTDTKQSEQADPDESADPGIEATGDEESPAEAPELGPMVEEDVLDSEAPAEPRPPELGSEGCATRAEGRRIMEESNAFIRETKLREAYGRGWKRLIDVREFSIQRQTLTRVRPGGARGDGLGALFVDPDGHHWLVAYETTSCEPVTVDFFLDAEKDVFPVYPEQQCQQTKTVPVCESMGANGCGRKSPLRRIYVRVPADAKLVPSTTVPVEIPTCYQVEPKGGFIPRP
ncbi:hypothetical protein FRD00_00820 [Persicimonas caeni]|nr:hypothetical protein FRD00_00820 [Persicimonas caeni]